MEISNDEIANHFLCREFLNVFTNHFNVINIEERERVFCFNSRLSVYVNNEENTSHNRPHAHITINGKRIGRIWIDTFEIDNEIEKRDCKIINQWLQNHKQDLIDAWKRNNNKIDIAFKTL